MNVYTHDRVSLTGGLLAISTLLWGGNALQTINVTRNTPKNPAQAIGYLGIVDYTRGVVTSDVMLDAILTEKASGDAQLASANSTAYKYAGQNVGLDTEQYAMTSFAMALAAGTPVTSNYGWITGGLASYLKPKAQPTASDGTQVAMVLGDEGHGLVLLATWSGSAPASSTVPVMSDAGVLGSVSDNGLPIGVQSLNLSANINRDQILDVRSTRPATFVTTYPVDVGMDMEVLQLPGAAGAIADPSTTAAVWGQLTSLKIVAASDPTIIYANILGLQKQTEGESSSVGRYLAYTVHFRGTELWIPCGNVS